MTDKLKTLAEEVLKLDGEATKAPWIVVTDLPQYAVWAAWSDKDVVTSESRRYVAPNRNHLGSTREDTHLIAKYRDSAPQLARALIKALAVVEAAKKVWDSDEFFEDENGRTDEVDTEAILALGDALAEFEGDK